MEINLDHVKDKLKENYKAFAAEYKNDLEASYRKKVANTQPGEPAPGRGLTDQEIKAFKLRVNVYRKRADAIIENVKNQIAADVTEAPSSEAVNYITMLSRRENVSPYEIEFARNTYGRNFACYAALQEAAAKNGHYIEDHPTRAALDAISAFERCNKDYTYETISNPEHSPEFTASLYAAGIDGNLFIAADNAQEAQEG